MIRSVVAVIGVLASPAVIYVVFGAGDVTTGPDGRFLIPNLSSQAQDGREHFAAACGACHGAYGEGSDSGPMLVHALYARAVFPDSEIVRAAHEGAVARNWPFGNMPAIEGMRSEKLLLIVDFLREVQAANGIE